MNTIYTVQNYETTFGEYENYEEAMSLVLKLGDNNKLAFISKDGNRLYGNER